jgi:hypothetical protein
VPLRRERRISYLRGDGAVLSRRIPVAAGERIQRDGYGYGYCDLVMAE